MLATSLGFAMVSSAAPQAQIAPPLTEAGDNLRARYAGMLKDLQVEIGVALPKLDVAMMAELGKAREAIAAAEAEASVAQQSLGKIQTAKALVAHAKGKWIGGAEKGIAQAEAALRKATTQADREAAQSELAKWQENKEDGIKALHERQAALDKVQTDEPQLIKANESAQAALARARARESMAAGALLGALDPFLSSDQLDAKLAKCTVLAEATPQGLAGFAQQGLEQERLIEKLLGSDALMKEMLEAGGAKFDKYGPAVEIYAAIRKASPRAAEGSLRRLALATSLEHAMPIAQSKRQDQSDAPASVDPVKRYLHYEKAYQDGELDPAFANLSTWEYRMVVNCDAPDEILAWGREMLRTYRPDHILNPDYGWRYSAAVRSEVPYGSQNVKFDLPSLHQHQNIVRNGGVCGRRAFFGRFILRSFGIPTWGVTQHKHAALSHWTPKGWVVNLGAGFEHSWWDKDEAPRSGADFLLETQARAHSEEYWKVLRAQWVSSLLGEPQYNDRKRVDGGFWSSIAHYQTVALASTAAALGPLGQELAEANEPEARGKLEQAKLAEADRQITVSRDGTITIPAVAFSKPTRNGQTMQSFSGGMQLHCTGGFTASYEFEAPRAGKYALAARVATVQVGQRFQISVDTTQAPVEIAVPYTLGRWEPSQLAELSLNGGKNCLEFALTKDSRGVTIKEFTLTPVN